MSVFSVLPKDLVKIQKTLNELAFNYESYFQGRKADITKV